MTANAIVQARVNEAIKKEAAAVLEAMGLTISDAVRLLLVRVAQDHALPFEPLIPNEKTIAAMKEARKGKLKSFSSVQDLMGDLNGTIEKVVTSKKEKIIQLGPNDDSEKEITLKMDLSVENNNSFVRGKSRSLKEIEEWVLSDYDFKRPGKDSDIYEITLKYTTYENLDEQIEHIIGEAASIADRRHCHMDDCDFYTFDGENSYPFSED